ncbi:MAG: ABC transporter substrate-binding protein [Nocardioides sp.]|uniref:ABC transporter substrate-binding protein n=1 Tax=Nocardioides sp. TaxID=35761 RepID=UPI003EFDFFD5
MSVRRRTRLLPALAAVGLLLTAAGCGSGGGDAQASGETRTVTDAEGTEMKVPAAPERVVALSEPTLDGVLALGVEPVGTVTGRGQSTVPAYLADAAADIPVLGGVAQPNYEAIGKADPDLILVDGTSINNNPEAISILRKVAPTYVTGFAGGDWRDNFTHVGQALGMDDEVEDVVAAYDQEVGEAKEQLGGYADSTFSIVRWQGGSAALILKELPGGQALEDLGLTRPEGQDRRGRGHSEPVSLENLSEIDADYLFFGTLGGSSVGNAQAGGTADADGARTALTEAEKVPGFRNLEAYREGHVILVDGSLWTSTGGPLLMRGLVASVVDSLA